ncbi:MAG: phospho-sugar mutase [Bacteroidetes bacterium]|nr:MAG: phospho-sugar mutase [Bacteroidota bacterium]
MTALDASIQQKVQLWLDSNIEPAAKAEIQTLLSGDNPDAVIDAFYQDLEFGTGGLRGIMGIGSNRVNQYTLGMATQGFSNYLNKAFPGGAKVAIAYDSRNNSQFFGEITAAVFSANGIKVYLFEALRPTPELSFSIRYLGCQGGVVLTASHNPKEYNGYKAYWDDGGQVTPPHDKNIVAEVQKITLDEVKFTANESLIERISTLIDDPYLEAITTNVVSPEVIARQHDLKIVYSPIHGTGITMVPRILAKIGFDNVHVVEAQATPNGNFPTVIYPNPEEADAMNMALNLARELDADLVMGTDPDADRVGIGVKNHHGEWQLLNGNQAATCMIYYLLKAWQEKGKLDGGQFIAKTIVTTDILDKMAAKFDVDCYNVLTGFKYIAELIKELEGKKKFIGGGEESYGYLVNDFVRDKDAIISCAMLAEVVAWAKDQGKSLFDILLEVYSQFGLFREGLISLSRKGKKGAEEIQQMMADLRSNPPKTINGSEVLKMQDYKSLIEKDLRTGEETKLDFPTSNVLQFHTADGSKISARPSGTEPKIKFYFSVQAPVSGKEDFDAVYAMLGERIQAIVDGMGLK